MGEYDEQYISLYFIDRTYEEIISQRSKKRSTGQGERAY
jgi:hypothetical protein